MDLGQRLTAQERPLRLLLTHLVGPALRARVELEDMVQEVYLRALGSAENAPELRSPPDHPPGTDACGDEPLFAWMRVLARRTVVDAVRALRARKRDGAVVRLERSEWSSAGIGGVSNVPDPGPGPPTRLAFLEQERLLQAAFESLRPEHRRVLGLRQFEGLSAAEAARRMGRTESAVHSLYRRALGAWEGAAQATRSESGSVSSGMGDESERDVRPISP